MSRMIALTLFSLSFRIFAVPSLCGHVMPGIGSEALAIEAGKSAMPHCHMHSAASKNQSPKQIPCNHMKQCLLDAAEEDTFFQKTMDTASLSAAVLDAFWVPALLQNLSCASAESAIFNRPPPDTLYSHIAIYITKASLLI